MRVISRYLVKLCTAAALALFGSAAWAAEQEFPKDAGAQEMVIRQFVINHLLSTPADFDKLEEFARDLRGKIERREANENAIGTYYFELGLHAVTMAGQQKVVQWRQRMPASPTPALVTVAGRFSMAINDFFLATGSNWVWHELPQSRPEIEGARKDLLAIKSFATEDPYWYVLMAYTSIALRNDRAELDALVEEGLKSNPKNYALIEAATAGYLSKWGGDADALERHAQRVLAWSAPDDGAANYARIYDIALRAQYGVLMFDYAKPDWKVLMAGVRDLVKQDPSPSDLNRAAVLACAGGNRNLTRETLLHANFVYSDAYWYNIGTRKAPDRPYGLCRQWAGSAG
jgi:hypothetical protein